MEFGNRTAPRRWPGGGYSLVTVLIALNVAVWLLQLLADAVSPGWMDRTFALSREGMAEGYYWQLLTYMFLHGGILHLLVNCLGLYFVGPEVETVCGPRHFLGIYFLGGIFGGVAQLIFGAPFAVMGASAGVCAIVLAFTTMLPDLEITALLYFIIPIRMKAKWLGRIVIGSSIFFFITGYGGNVAHLAHLGGAFFGWFYTRRLGFGGPFWMQRYLNDRKRLRERQEQMDPKEFISQEIDPILDKIAREGIHSLTRAERHILEMGREKIAKKTVPPFR